MATKVKSETIKSIASMGQKEALRKYHAGEGDDEFRTAVKRYYSSRRIEAAKKGPPSSVAKSSAAEAPKTSVPVPSQAAIGRKIGGPRMSHGKYAPGSWQEKRYGSKSPIEKAVGSFRTTGPKGGTHQERQTPGERLGEKVSSARKGLYKPGPNVKASRAKAKASAYDPLKEALKKRR